MGAVHPLLHPPKLLLGEAQAQALGDRLASVDITRAVASPLSRAQRTAQLALGAARADMLLTEPELQEIAHGEWEGLLASEIHEKDPSRLQAWREEPDVARYIANGRVNVSVRVVD